MQVIIEHNKDASPYLKQYSDSIESLGINYTAVEIEEKYLCWLSEIAHAIEPNFTIELCGDEEIVTRELIDCSNIILATIGASQQMQEADCFYHITEHNYKMNYRNKADRKGLWISCSSENNQITALDYIKCIAYLKDFACELHKPILIYVNSYIPDESFRYKSITSKVISHYLDAIDGGIVIKCMKGDNDKYCMPMRDSYESYTEQVIYLSKDLKSIIIEALPFIKNKSKDENWFEKLHEQCRQSSVLFENDFFYNTISPDEEIYVFLDVGNYRPPEYYEALGLKTIRLIGDYGMLYARKSQFDALSNVLRPDVTPRHRIPILSHAPCEREQDYQLEPYSLATEELSYKGRGVYIGLITTDDVDYTNEALRYQDGSTRITYIWQQIRADEGIQYFKEQIDTALVSPTPEQIVPLPLGESMSTMMLGIAGGESFENAYRGIATEAEFIVAKLKPASAALQRTYGGMPSSYGVILQDVMIGVLELINFAAPRGIPLVLCMPFNTNIDPHDGSLILYEILVLIARRAGVTLIIPTGEEGDKQHHYGIQTVEEALRPVVFRVQRENQNMIGVIYQRFSPILTAFLYPPPNITANPINLTRAGVTPVFGATVYSNGERTDFLNGARRIHFRIENPQVGEWRLQSILETGELSQINLWISQQELNPYITISPSSPFITLGSSACIDNAMVVGGYDQELGVVLRSSGRGYTWDERVRPLLITSSRRITAPCSRTEWVSVTGTLPAVSIMAGVAATLYSKFIAEGRVPLPNTLAINNILLNIVQQFQGVVYPNRNQGYGIFDLQLLNTLLSGPIQYRTPTN